MSNLTRYITLSCSAQSSELRIGVYDETEYVIVPVVAMVGNSVIRPMGSDDYEFVPSEVLSQCPQSWANRPIIPDHPGMNSANEPKTLEANRFGHVFYPFIRDGNLHMEAWLDPARAEKVGESAIEVVRKCKAGETIEVSIGAWVTAVKEDGSINGHRYGYRWTSCTSDHLAMGLNGKKGACNVEMGCGAPRSMEENMAGDKTKTDPGSSSPVKQGLFQRVMSALGLRSSQSTEGVSDSDLRESLWKALHAVEPGFDWIVEVYPDSSTVVYTTMPEEMVLWWRRTYTMSDAGEVSLNDDREQVEMVTTYEPVKASTDQPACKCNKGEHMAEKSKPSPAIATLATSLITCAASPFEETDRTSLEAMSEDKLKAFVAKLSASADKPDDEKDKPVEATPEPATVDPVPVTVKPSSAKPTAAEWLSSAPLEIRETVSRAMRAEADHRNSLLATLTANQTTFTREQLNLKPTDELAQLCDLLNLSDQPCDYSASRSLIGAKSVDHNPPDAWGLKGAN